MPAPNVGVNDWMPSVISAAIEKRCVMCSTTAKLCYPLPLEQGPSTRVEGSWLEARFSAKLYSVTDRVETCRTFRTCWPSWPKCRVIHNIPIGILITAQEPNLGLWLWTTFSDTSYFLNCRYLLNRTSPILMHVKSPDMILWSLIYRTKNSWLITTYRN